jgi:hypothetical protein
LNIGFEQTWLCHAAQAGRYAESDHRLGGGRHIELDSCITVRYHIRYHQ